MLFEKFLSRGYILYLFLVVDFVGRMIVKVLDFVIADISLLVKIDLFVIIIGRYIVFSVEIEVW